MPGLAASGLTDATVSVLRGGRISGPDARYLSDTEPVDIFIVNGKIFDIAPVGTLRTSGQVLDISGTWVIPGLWDNHVHSVQWALGAQRTDLSRCESAEAAAHTMAGSAALPDGRRLGAGYRSALWSDLPTLDLLDRVTGDAPTYLINQDVHSVWLNSAALSREGFWSATGVLQEEDAFEISRRLNATDPVQADQALRAAIPGATARGVVGLVDFDMDRAPDSWQRRISSGWSDLRVEAAIYPTDLEHYDSYSFVSDQEIPGSGGLLRWGPLKLITDGSLGTQTAACTHAYSGQPQHFGALNIKPEQLAEQLLFATSKGLAVAVHAIGDAAVHAALRAFAATGARGSIEHAQLVAQHDISAFARLGVIASVQPQHALDDFELANRLWAEQTSLAYPLRSLADSGAQLRFGSDAPVAALDPWFGIAAAMERSGGTDPLWQADESLTWDQALTASTRTRIMPGEPADLLVLEQDPSVATPAQLRQIPVAITMLAGTITYSRL